MAFFAKHISSSFAASWLDWVHLWYDAEMMTNTKSQRRIARSSRREIDYTGLGNIEIFPVCSHKDVTSAWRCTILCSRAFFVCRHYSDCLICRYHLTTIFATLALGTKNPPCESNNNGTAFSEEKWTQGNNRQRQKWQLAKHLLSEKAEKFQTLARMAYYFHLLKKSFDAVLGMRGTMDPTPRCTGTKQRSRHGRDHNATRRYFQQKSWNNRISAELWQKSIYVKRFPATRLFQL